MNVKILNWKKWYLRPRFAVIRANITVHDDSAVVEIEKVRGRPERRHISSKRAVALGVVTLASYLVIGAESDDEAQKFVMQGVAHDPAVPVAMSGNVLNFLGQKTRLDANLPGEYFVEVEILK